MRMKGETFPLLIIEAQSVMLIMPPSSSLSPSYHPHVFPLLSVSFLSLSLFSLPFSFSQFVSFSISPISYTQLSASTILLLLLPCIFKLSRSFPSILNPVCTSNPKPSPPGLYYSLSLSFSFSLALFLCFRDRKPARYRL